jgi:hypothetical protein
VAGTIRRCCGEGGFPFGGAQDAPPGSAAEEPRDGAELDEGPRRRPSCGSGRSRSVWFRAADASPRTAWKTEGNPCRPTPARRPHTCQHRPAPPTL